MSASNQMDTKDGQDNGESMRERERDYFVCVSREIFDEHKLPLRDARLYVVQEGERERERGSHGRAKC